METLRWILLLVGLAIILAVYLAGRRTPRGVVDDFSSADPVISPPREEPRREIRQRHPEVNDVDHELSLLSNLIAENRRSHNVVTEQDDEGIPTVTVVAPNTTATATAPDFTPVAKTAPARLLPPPEEKIVVVYIMAAPGGRFSGSEVLRAIEDAGLKHGNMNIFHRLADPDDEDSDAVFSLANSIEPGIFNLDKMDDFSTPGLTLFMQLPGPMNGITAADSMLAAAHIIATALRGELRDQSRNVMRKQTIEQIHCDIIEYQRRQRLALTGS